MDPVDQKVLDDIERTGWSDIAVFPTKQDEGLPFNYTVGLTKTYGHSELMIQGMSNEQMHQVMGSAVAAIRRGVKFRPNTYSNEVLSGHRVAFVEVLDTNDPDFPLSMARRLMGVNMHALHMVWPDREDKFPWDSGYDQTLNDRQVLGAPWMGE